MKKDKKIALGVAGLLVGAAAVSVALAYRNRRTIPEGVEAINPFDAARYMGKWYEIARMPMSYEKHMSYVTAEYSFREDGTVKVVNRGYDEKKKRWQETNGRGRFVNDPEEGCLEISFFGPFYSGYNVVDIDEEYKYALVFGRNMDYMWLLSREPEMPEEMTRRFLEKANDIGYDLYRLIWTEQEVLL